MVGAGQERGEGEGVKSEVMVGRGEGGKSVDTNQNNTLTQFVFHSHDLHTIILSTVQIYLRSYENKLNSEKH